MRPRQGDSECGHPLGLDEWPTLCPVDATPEERQLRAATARRKRLEAQLRTARLDERAAIAAALASRIRQVQICAITGYTREHVRRLAQSERDDHSSATGT